MLPLLARHKLNSSILSIGSSARSVILLDSNYHVYELEDGEFVFSQKIFDYEPQHQFSKACATSMNGYIAIGEPKSPNCRIFHIKNKRLTPLKTLSWHKADIYNIRFSRNGKYLVSGGEDGKVFVFSLPSFSIVNILPPRPDYISNIHFGKNANLVVYSSYDMMNCVFDMNTNEIVGEFETNAVAEDMTFFDDDRKIFFICSNGESGIYDIQKREVNLAQNYSSWLTRVGMSKDDNFAYIGARDNILSYLRLDSNMREFSLDLKRGDGVVSMRVVQAKLYIGYASGYLEVFDLARFEGEFLEALESSDIKKAREISEKNISLKTFKKYIELKDSLWNVEFKKAQDSLVANPASFKEAIKALEVFFEDREKREEFEEFAKNIGVAKELNEALNARNYPLAYKIINEHSYLKDTLDYERLEGVYNEAFEGAKKLLENDNADDSLKAQDLLKPFINIPSKREAINTLLRNSSKFLQADRLLKHKQFGEFFKLAESFRVLKDTLNYKKALAFGEQILSTINELELRGENLKALELIEVLAKFTPFAKMALERKQILSLKLEFIELYKAKEYLKIFKQLEKFKPLQGMVEYIALNKELSDSFDNMLELANRGESKLVYKNLEPYFAIEHFSNKVSSILNISYINEIALHLKEQGIDWKTTLSKYISIFGKSDEMANILINHKEILEIFNSLEDCEKKDREMLNSIIFRI